MSVSVGKIYCFMGKSSSGKDTVFQLVTKQLPQIKPVVPYTTRPMRVGEKNGETYFFITPEQLKAYEDAGKVIEVRHYNTVQGIWSYATIDDGQITLANNSYFIIATLEAYEKIVQYYGQEQVVPLYITVEDGVRLQRAIEREQRQAKPDYAELCRRFLADHADFSEEKLTAAGITKRYENVNLDACVAELIREIQTMEDGEQ